MGFLLSKLLPLGLYPLGLALLLQIAGLLTRQRRIGLVLSSVGIVLLWLAATPLLSRQLVWGLEEQAARLTPSPIPKADAVLVLGGGLRPALPPRQGVEVNEAGDRLLRAVALMREDKAPWLLVTGGKVSFMANDPASGEAKLAKALATSLGVAADRIVTSEEGRNTAEETSALVRVARQRGWTSLLLVTSATHLPRSLATLRRAAPEFRIIPVACDFQLPDRRSFGTPTLASSVLGLLPSAEALVLTTTAMREHLGLLAYRWKGWI
ncbi:MULTISPECIES: YdcF family protein [unclassified Cyanobium]|uniref:YdcF family protein n=1 Tax=unclassified Cyanobium TaxID=2627006 RepID=UPI0020CE6347|nr:MULTISPECIES: YdcF family protein [unclassified Cyanobium]MCP9834461.1 YdcF family protein [Cyanobium sp. La Preciosa 7G6]MCP9937167.1 YdcF family protein [Cyanobium sp. Aljojuca 7A6]